jgi:hypothetical protein
MKHPVHYTPTDDTALCDRLTRLAPALLPADAETVREAERRLQCLSGLLIRVAGIIRSVKVETP